MVKEELFLFANNKNVSHTKITHGSNPSEEKFSNDSSISTHKVIKINYSLLSSIKYCTDTNAKDLVIKTVLSIISEFAVTQDE